MRIGGLRRRLARAELSDSDVDDDGGAAEASDGAAADDADVVADGDRGGLAPNGQLWAAVRDLPANPPLRRRETMFSMDHVLQGHEPTLLGIFKAYFPCTEIDRIVSATKLAAKGKLNNLTGDEFFRFLGVLLAVGLSKGAVPRDQLWDRKRTDSVRPAFDFNRFGMSRNR